MATVSEVLNFDSGRTSRTVDIRDAFDISFSISTSAGTTSTHTLWVSNWTGRLLIDGNPPEAQWSAWTSFLPSTTTDVHPVLGPRYLRFSKPHTTPTFVVSYTKTLHFR